MSETQITLSQLEQYLAKAAWILKGPVDASDFKVYIFPLLFFKRISDVYDEEYRQALQESEGDEAFASLPEMHRFAIPDGAHWNDVRESTTNVGMKIEDALRAIEKANQEQLFGIFGDAQWSNKNKLSDRLLTDLIEHFSKYKLSNSNVAPDMLGQAYEYLIKHFADLTNKKAGGILYPTGRCPPARPATRAPGGREHLRSRLRHGRNAAGMCRAGEGKGWRIPHPATVRTGEKPHLQLHRPYEHVSARH